jgi:hypothetical protein
MTTDRELMQQALSALTQASPSGWSMDSTKRHYDTIEALRARLAQPDLITPGGGLPNDHNGVTAAQPEQKPVAWIKERELLYMQAVAAHGKTDWKTNLGLIPEEGDMPLYTAPPQREWQSLTENEIKHLWYEACQTNLELTSQLIVHLVRNIEAKLREKNNG